MGIKREPVKPFKCFSVAVCRTVGIFICFFFLLCVFVQISSAVCFLLSPAASYISGATLRVDAGQSLYHSMWDIPGTYILLMHSNSAWQYIDITSGHDRCVFLSCFERLM